MKAPTLANPSMTSPGSIANHVTRSLTSSSSAASHPSLPLASETDEEDDDEERDLSRQEVSVFLLVVRQVSVERTTVHTL